MNAPKRTYYEDGTLQSEYGLENGTLHGLYREWHQNGILAMEFHYDHGMINGIVKQWNKNGELTATSQLIQGTEVLPTCDPMQGRDGEITFVDGKRTGRQLCYRDGELIAIAYWLENKYVSRKRYVRACEKHQNLPRYEHDRKLGLTRGQRRLRKDLISLPIKAILVIIIVFVLWVPLYFVMLLAEMSLGVSKEALRVDGRFYALNVTLSLFGTWGVFALISRWRGRRRIARGRKSE